MNYRSFFLLLCSCLYMNFSMGQSKKKMSQLIKNDFAFADSQYRLMAKSLPGDVQMPQSFNFKKGVVTSFNDIHWWCTGFYPGNLWYIYEATGDTVIKNEAVRALDYIEANKTYTGNHDLGFMMYCSFGNGYRLTHNPAYKDVIFQSAASLSTRFRPGIPAIQSWNKSAKFNCPVIIDNMMNLELLNWVSQNGGDAKYEDIAIKHANTTMKNHFRPDYSSYHVIDYDPNTGKVLQKRTHQGLADSSAWARGQGWGLYGYTMMYRFTKDTSYLNFARHIAHYILTNPNLPKDKVPYWDFNDPRIPSDSVPRDASAGALIASALLELGQYTKGKEKKVYVQAAATILESLSSSKYRAPLGSTGGFLLLHSTGALPMKSEVDVPLIYADYYFLEALKRYKDWYL